MNKISDDVKNRALGCLYGQAIGDALGTTYEFSSRRDTVKKAEQLKKGGNIIPIVGNGPFHLDAGQVTDDTELAMALAHSLTKRQTYHPAEAAEAYLTWFESSPFDVGNTTRAAFSNIRKRGDKLLTQEMIYERMKGNAQTSNTNALSNGCLMRISPLAIAGTTWDREALLKASQLDCPLTNPNEVAKDAVACYVAAMQSLIQTSDAEQSFRVAESIATTETIKKHLADARLKPNPTIVKVKGTFVEKEPESAFRGYLGVALQIAFYNMLHAKSFQEGVENTVLLGGDTDTNGCIAAALIGARCGADAIPTQWKRSVTSVKPNDRQRRYPWSNLSNLEQICLDLLNCHQPE